VVRAVPHVTGGDADGDEEPVYPKVCISNKTSKRPHYMEYIQYISPKMLKWAEVNLEKWNIVEHFGTSDPRKRPDLRTRLSICGQFSASAQMDQMNTDERSQPNHFLSGFICVHLWLIFFGLASRASVANPVLVAASSALSAFAPSRRIRFL
jgi:hypothetical protein